MDDARSVPMRTHGALSVSGATIPVHSPVSITHELGERVFATFPEAWMEAAHALRGEGIHAAPLRR
jgi:hypothetical protein